MIQYLVIILDDTSTSFCYYSNGKKARRLIPIEMLKAGILYAMKENLNVQFVYPDEPLPKEYDEIIDSVDSIKIKPSKNVDDADIIVFNDIDEAKSFMSFDANATYVLRLKKQMLFDNAESIVEMAEKSLRLNIVLTDVETFTDYDFSAYKNFLSRCSVKLENLYVAGKSPQLNILTDRMMLEGMNNCGAGDTVITLAPDGKFYACPAFYFSADGYAVGNLQEGLDIKNPQLYKLHHAPLCRICDAYQCKRCVWLNSKTTLEVNTPSHEQCVVSHLERNASRELQTSIRKHGVFLPDIAEIKEISYLDPFDVREKW